MRRTYGKPDAENPEVTTDDFARARPAHEVWPDLIDPQNHIKTGSRRRGPQRSPRKQIVTIRLSGDVVTAYKSTGRGWQSRIDADLLAGLKRKKKSKPRRAAGSNRAHSNK